MKIDPKHFDTQVLQAKTPVLVDFYGVHCPPCRQLAPIIDKLANEYAICKVDIEEYPELSQRYSITSIPTLMLFKDGQLLEKLVGLQSEQRLRALLAAAH